MLKIQRNILHSAGDLDHGQMESGYDVAFYRLPEEIQSAFLAHHDSGWDWEGEVYKLNLDECDTLVF